MTLSRAPGEHGWYAGAKRFERQGLTAKLAGPRVDFGLPLQQVHPVIISEVLSDMELAMRPLPRVLCCAHCDAPIDGDAPRVGVYSSNRRQGTASAWVHFECHRDWTALESIEALRRELS